MKSEPCPYATDGCVLENNEVGPCVCTNYLPGHIAQLLDALNGLLDFVEIDNLKMDPLALSIARKAVGSDRG